MVKTSDTAILIVDVQRDFCRGGALEVPDGDAVVPILNGLVERLAADHVHLYASRDWHPTRTTHFQADGGVWPPHCIAGTRGAEFHPDLRLPASASIVTKGETPDAEGYSAFDGHLESGLDLLADLRTRNVRRLLIGGLATDYCVRASVLDACAAGFEVTVIDDGIAAVELESDHGAQATADMKAAGAIFARAEDATTGAANGRRARRVRPKEKGA
jgi:nicotinamidase/pyrazinamidase